MGKKHELTAKDCVVVVMIHQFFVEFGIVGEINHIPKGLTVVHREINRGWSAARVYVVGWGKKNYFDIVLDIEAECDEVSQVYGFVLMLGDSAISPDLFRNSKLERHQNVFLTKRTGGGQYIFTKQVRVHAKDKFYNLL